MWTSPLFGLDFLLMHDKYNKWIAIYNIFFSLKLDEIKTMYVQQVITVQVSLSPWLADPLLDFDYLNSLHDLISWRRIEQHHVCYIINLWW